MANGDYGYFGKGDTGYAQYMTAFNRNFGGSSGGGGTGAQVALMQAGIQMFGGVSGDADAVVADYLTGKLVFDPDVHWTHHDHEEGHSCGSHSCHEDKGGCAGNCH